MTAQNTTFGFITAVEVPELGHCGGLLLLNSIGRPLEFHCTAPVATNRAQQILFGQTYYSFLYCDQIGLALMAKAHKKPSILITNTSRMLPLSGLVTMPLALLATNDAADCHVQPDKESLEDFVIHDQTIRTQHLDPDAFSLVREKCIQFTESLPLDEPFERIQQAIDEAQAIVR
jgi:hypothetical protein